MCAKFTTPKRGGRPSKKATKRGRPKGTSVNQLVDYISEIATHTPPTSLQSMELKDTESNVACRYCDGLLKNPVELSCTHHTCAECVKQHLISSKSLTCPQCAAQLLIEYSSVSPASQLLLQLLEQVQVRCTLCNRTLFAADGEKHLQSKCADHTISALGLSAVMEQSPTTPLNDAEKKIGDYMVRRMASGTVKPIPISTGGPVSLNYIQSLLV